MAHAVEPARQARVRPRWWAELSFVAVVYGLYVVVRMAMPQHTGDAFKRGAELLGLEKAWHLAPEVGLNAAVSSHWLLAVIFDYHYATLHYVVTPAVLVWLLISHPASYRHARRILVATTMIGLVGFWLTPVAPPRMLGEHGFVDTMAQFAGYGWWSTDASAPRGLGGLTNEFAAMPSLHVGWAIWCGWMMYRFGRHRWTKLAGILYPTSTVIVVMATANHFFLDVVGGAVVLMLGAVVVGAGERAWRRRRASALSVPARTPVSV